MKGHIILKTKSKEEAYCIKKLIKEKSTAFNNYLVIKPRDLDSFENYQRLCGVDKAYYAFRFNSTNDVAAYIEKTTKTKPINFVYEEGSQEDLYKLIEDYLRISENGRISEIEPKEIFKLLEINGLHYLVQYETYGSGGFCNEKGERSVFIDGSYESYCLAYKFLYNGQNLLAIIPFNKSESELRNILINLIMLSRSCQNRKVNLYICSLDSPATYENKIEVKISSPIFMPGGSIYNEKIISIPIELLNDTKIPEEIKQIKSETIFHDPLKCNLKAGVYIIDAQNKPVNFIIDNILEKLKINKNSKF